MRCDGHRSKREMIVAGEAHVWLAALGEREARRPDWLDPDERAQWRRYTRAADRDLFLVAHTHLRATLSRYADIAPQAWRFVRAGGGRPEVCGEQDVALRFNLSHTPGLVACVVTHGAACGVDVERDEHLRDWSAVAPSVLHPEERAALARRPEDFLAYWTLKESYLKATGRGIRVALPDVRFELRAEPAVSFDHGLDTPAGWSFAHIRPTDAHHLAVAVRPARVLKVQWA